MHLPRMKLKFHPQTALDGLRRLQDAAGCCRMLQEAAGGYVAGLQQLFNLVFYSKGVLWFVEFISLILNDRKAD